MADLDFDLVAESVDPHENHLKWGPSAGSGVATVERGLCTDVYPVGFITLATLAPGTDHFEDTTPDPGVCYTYAVTVGATTSQSSVTTQECKTPGKAENSSNIISPVTMDPSNPSMIAEQVDQLTTMLNPTFTDFNYGNPCRVCPIPNFGNGGIFLGTASITLDCGRCTSFIIDTSVVTALAAPGVAVLINSIAMRGCCEDSRTHHVEILVDTGAKVKMCGWPTGSGADGGECTDDRLQGSTLSGD